VAYNHWYFLMAYANFASASVVGLHAISQNLVGQIEFPEWLFHVHFVEEGFCDAGSTHRLFWLKVERKTVIFLFHRVQKSNRTFNVSPSVLQFLFGHSSGGLVAHLPFQAKRSECLVQGEMFVS